MDNAKHYDDAEIALIDARCKSNSHRLDEQDQRIKELEKNDADTKVLVSRMGRMESDVKEIKTDVRELTARSGKRWESLVDKILAALAGAFVAWVLAGGMGA